MVFVSFLWDLVVRLCISLVLVVIHASIFHKIATKMEFEDKSFDNPTSIAIILGILFVLISYFTKISLALFIIGGSIFPIILLKEFYMIGWKRAIEAWSYWLLSWIAITFVMTVLAILIF